MRYFIVHLHRLLDPGQDTEVLQLRSPAVETFPSRFAAQQLGSARAGRPCGRISAAGLADQQLHLDPADVYERVEPQMPAIFAFWHGQHFMTPFIKTKESHRAKVLISRHRDGEFNAIAAERLGIGTIRGSGDHGGAFHRKGGVGAFREMLQALEDKLERRDHRRRAETRAGRRARHHHAGAGVGPADHAVRDGDQPIHPVEELGLALPSICRSGAARWSASRLCMSRRMPMPRRWKSCVFSWKLT